MTSVQGPGDPIVVPRDEPSRDVTTPSHAPKLDPQTPPDPGRVVTAPPPHPAGVAPPAAGPSNSARAWIDDCKRVRGSACAEQLRALADSPGFAGLPQDVRDAALFALTRVNVPALSQPSLAALVKLCNSSELAQLPEDERRVRVLSAMGELHAARMPEAKGAFASLLKSAAFTSAPKELQAAALSQAINWCSLTSLAFIERALSAPWLTGCAEIPAAAGHPAYSPLDQCRAMLNVLGYAGAMIDALPPGADARVLLEHTYDRVLPPTGTFALQMMWSAPDLGGFVSGWARDSVLALNIAVLGTDARPVDRHADYRLREQDDPKDGMTFTTLRHTPAHEVNHRVNNDRNGPTFAYSEAEYSAWFVGVLAERGKPPSAFECFERVRILLRDSGYADIKAALYANNAESQQVLAFLARFAPPSDGGPLVEGTPEYAAFIADQKSADRVMAWTSRHLSRIDAGSLPKSTRNVDNR